jgi:hypothetical protein
MHWEPNARRQSETLSISAARCGDLEIVGTESTLRRQALLVAAILALLRRFDT